MHTGGPPTPAVGPCTRMAQSREEKEGTEGTQSRQEHNRCSEASGRGQDASLRGRGVIARGIWQQDLYSLLLSRMSIYNLVRKGQVVTAATQAQEWAGCANTGMPRLPGV